MVGRHLERYGRRLLEAASAWEGLRVARLELPDLVLLDAALPPAEDGHLLALLRSDVRTARLPVILLVAESARPQVAELEPLGVTACLLKPFEQRAFDKEVSKVLGLATAPTRRPVDRKAVMLVDADTGRIDAVRRLLDTEMTVLVAGSSRDALAMYAKLRPGVVVVDLGLPQMEGYRAMARLEDLGPSAFVALVECGDTEERDWALEVGCQAVLEKPVTAQSLVDNIRRAVAAVATAEDVVSRLLVEEGHWAMLQMPDPHAGSFGRIRAALRRTFRAMAGSGRDTLIVDLTAVAAPQEEALGAVLGLIEEAERLGLQTAVCAPPRALVEQLGLRGRTKYRVYASREAAREAFQ